MGIGRSFFVIANNYYLWYDIMALEKRCIMGRNAKFNKRLLKRFANVSDEDLFYYVNYKMERYYGYVKACDIARDLLVVSGFDGITCYRDKIKEVGIFEIRRIAKLRNIVINTSCYDVRISANDVKDILGRLCYLNMERDYSVWNNGNDCDVLLDDKERQLGIYRFFYDIIDCISYEDIALYQDCEREIGRSKRYER